MAGESLIATTELTSETRLTPNNSGAANLSLEAFPSRLSGTALQVPSTMAAETVQDRFAADIRGLVATEVSELGFACALSAAGLLRSGRVPEAAMNAMTLGVGFLSGGLINNRVAGRPWLASEGFKRNAIGSSIAHAGFMTSWWLTR